MLNFSVEQNIRIIRDSLDYLENLLINEINRQNDNAIFHDIQQNLEEIGIKFQSVENELRRMDESK